MQLLRLLLVVLYLGACSLAQLISNGGFESPIWRKNWACAGGCSVTQDPDSYSGCFSARIFGRRVPWSGLVQRLTLDPSTPYELSAKVNIGALPSDVMLAKLMVRMHYDFQDGSSVAETIASMPHVTPEDGWLNVTTVFVTRKKSIVESKLSFRTKSARVEFRVDDVSLKALPRNPTWKAEAAERIRQKRMSDLEVKVNVRDDINPADVEIKVKLKKHSFPFGSVLNVEPLTNQHDPVYHKFREYFFENFNLAVLADSVRWKPMERTKRVLKSQRVYDALEILDARSVPVKGHCLIWGMNDKVPAWMLDEDDVTAEVDRRLQYMSDIFVQWDVYNEQLHSAWFEHKSRNANFLNRTFEKAHNLLPDTELFLNDFNLLNGAEFTGAMVQSAKKLVSQNSPVHGIGMQTHFRNVNKLDIDVIARRLEILGEAGLPLWATELDVNVTESKADWYENLLYLLYGDPNVEGIILWGFWSEAHWRPHAALVDGMDFEENETGRRVRGLWNNVWSTKESIVPNSHQSTSVVRAFHGEYDIKVVYRSEVVTELQVVVLDTSPLTSVEINV